MKIVAFLGPSMPVEHARNLCDAIYLPPAGQADLLSAVTQHKPDVIALIDGVFGQSLSVWHKEIIYALEQGVAVYGACSMGALRAVETSAYGTIGFGEVFRMYESGEIDGDDEVALSHADLSANFIGLSLPLVNVRKTFAGALDCKSITQAEHDLAVNVAKQIFFPERTIDTICSASEVSQDLSERLRTALSDHYVDIKRLDAENLLKHLSSMTEVPVFEKPQLTRSHLFQTMYHRDRLVEHDGTQIRLAAIAHHAALTKADFNELNANALNNSLVIILAETLGVDVTEDEINEETSRLKAKLNLQGEAALTDWCQRNDLQQDDFDKLIRKQAIVRKMQHWLISRRYLERTTACILDALRLSGQYESTAKATAEVEAVIEANYPDFQRAPGINLNVNELFSDHLTHSECKLDVDFNRWLFESGFKDVNDLRFELLRHRMNREHRLKIAKQLQKILANVQ